jgi:manganese/zinc/iron transport system permease protein
VLLAHVATTGNADQAGLERYLFGQAAGLLVGDVAVMAGIGAVALVAVAITVRAMRVALFDPRFAGAVGLPVRALEIVSMVLLVVAVVVGVRMVGAILMVAMLVAPTVAARQLTDRLIPLLLLAGLIGGAVGVSGALGSTAAMLPTGPVVVLAGVTVVLAAVLFAPGRGVTWRAVRLLRARRTALREAQLLDLGAGPLAAAPALVRRGLAERTGGAVHLTTAGRSALAEVRDRRALWSAWLAHGDALELPDAREPRPADLAAVLGPDRVARLRELAAAGSREVAR